MPAPSPPERILVLAAQRDEGAFLVEWVAWYRMLGFAILVAHNDCADRSPALLAAFADAGWLDAVAHSPGPGQPPKASAYRAVRGHPAIAGAAWMLVCDVDELLVVHRGDGTVGAFLDAMGRDVAGYAIHSQGFGNSGHATWRDGLVHERFQRAGPVRRGPNAFVKTLFRDPAAWRHLADHIPHGHAAGLDLGIVDSERRPIARLAAEPPPVRFTDEDAISHAIARINHYAVRSDEDFALKRGRASASALKDRYTDGFHRSRNANAVVDRSALAYAPAFARVHAQAMALPGVRRLHHLCCMDYAARLAALQGLAPEEDARWRRHAAEAARG